MTTDGASSASLFLPPESIRVLDFSKVLAGPLCTQYLKDMGAEVIQIEPCKGGDDTRMWPPFEDGSVTATATATKLCRPSTRGWSITAFQVTATVAS